MSRPAPMPHPDDDATPPVVKPSAPAGRHQRVAGRRPAQRMLDRLLAAPGWVQAVAIYVALKAVTTVLTIAVGRTQAASLWTKESPGYFEFASIWDGSWYQTIAEKGYPYPLPVDGFGDPVQSAWAFFPAYPFTVRFVEQITGLPFRVAAPTVSFLLGVLAAYFSYKLFRLKAPRGIALGGVAILAAWPSSPVMQYAYSESMCVMALAGVLYFMARRSYFWAIPWGVLVGLSRPVGMALVAATVFVAWSRWRHRAVDPFGSRERYGLLTLAVATAASSSVMLIATAIAGNRLDAYTAIQLAWRAQGQMEYFQPWLFISRYVAGPFWGPIWLGIGVALLVGIFLSRPVKRLGPEMYGWCLAYTLYLAAITDPYGQVTRLTLLLFPLCLALSDALRRRWALIGWLLLSLALQYWWIAILWRFSPPADVAP